MINSNKFTLNWDEYIKISNILIKEICENYLDYTALAIGRGGIIPSTMSCYHTNQRMEIVHVSSYNDENEKRDLKIHSFPWSNLKSIPKNILIIDDLIDSGDTMRCVINEIKKYIGSEYINYKIKTAVLIDKGQSDFKPDFASKSFNNPAWIKFPYE